MGNFSDRIFDRSRKRLNTPASFTVSTPRLHGRVNRVDHSVRPSPDPKLKGVRGGNCNRTACQLPGADYWHTGTHAWYCVHCTSDINHLNRADAMNLYGIPKLIVCPDTISAEERAAWASKGVTIPEASSWSVPT